MKRDELKTVQVMEKQAYPIIIVDDDADDINLFAEALTESSYTNPLTSFTSADNFLQFAQSDEIQENTIVFLDHAMPGKDGLECLKNLGNIRKLKHLKILFYSTFGYADVIQEAYDKNADFYIRKPNEFGQIVTIIKKALHTNWDNQAKNRNLQNFCWDHNLQF